MLGLQADASHKRKNWKGARRGKVGEDEACAHDHARVGLLTSDEATRRKCGATIMGAHSATQDEAAAPPALMGVAKIVCNKYQLDR